MTSRTAGLVLTLIVGAALWFVVEWDPRGRAIQERADQVMRDTLIAELTPDEIERFLVLDRAIASSLPEDRGRVATPEPPEIAASTLIVRIEASGTGESAAIVHVLTLGDETIRVPWDPKTQDAPLRKALQALWEAKGAESIRAARLAVDAAAADGDAVMMRTLDALMAIRPGTPLPITFAGSPPPGGAGGFLDDGEPAPGAGR